MKPNSIGVAGAIINYIGCGVTIIVSMLIFLPLITITQTNIWGQETGTSISTVFLIIFLVTLAFGILGIILTMRFHYNANKKILIGVLSIIFGFTNLIGFISGIFILVSEPRV